MTVASETRPAVVLDGSGDRSVLGGKGAALDRLIGWEIPVPETGVVTTAAYRSLVRAPYLEQLLGRLRDGEEMAEGVVDEAFTAVDFADDVASVLLAVARDIGGGGGQLAVRSSATVEDLAGSSFAGQYRSLLGIDPADAEQTLDAIRLVFASLWHPAPRAYRAAFGIDDADVAMAAVLMRMVDADRAGVVFTCDPGGLAGAARVEAVYGLGESLVSGQRTPDAWVVPRDLSGFDGPPEVAEALRLSLEIEGLAGSPQDVEWACAGSKTWIVQARPITVSAEETGDGFDSAIDDAELTTAGIGEMLPGVLPPLRWQLAGHLLNEAFARLVNDLGAADQENAARPFVRRVRGRAALDFDALRALADGVPGGSAEEMEAQYFGSRRPGRPAAKEGGRPSRLASLRHDVRTLSLQRRTGLDAEIAIRAVRSMEPVNDLTGFAWNALAAYQFRLIDLAVRATAAELAVAAAAASSYRKIELLVARHLGQAEAGRWAEVVTSKRGVMVTPTREASAAVFAGPTWTELNAEPPDLGAEVGRRVAGESVPADEEATDALLAALRAVGSWGDGGLGCAVRTRALRQVIDETVTLLHRREATKAALMRVGGEVRRTALEAGRRLVAAGVLDDATDVELLTLEEIGTCFGNRAVAPATLAGRKRWLARYETEPPLPIRFVGLPESEPADLPTGGRLDGWAASPGRVTGEAVAVNRPSDPFPTGAVLVAAATDASWSPLFVRAGGIVVERGGPLSHAAILARELGVPAVLNVPGATRVLGGKTVTVDGDLGVIVELESMSER